MRSLIAGMIFTVCVGAAFATNTLTLTTETKTLVDRLSEIAAEAGRLPKDTTAVLTLSDSYITRQDSGDITQERYSYSINLLFDGGTATDLYQSNKPRPRNQVAKPNTLISARKSNININYEIHWDDKTITFPARPYINPAVRYLTPPSDKGLVLKQLANLELVTKLPPTTEVKVDVAETSRGKSLSAHIVPGFNIPQLLNSKVLDFRIDFSDGVKPDILAENLTYDGIERLKSSFENYTDIIPGLRVPQATTIIMNHNGISEIEIRVEENRDTPTALEVLESNGYDAVRAYRELIDKRGFKAMVEEGAQLPTFAATP